MPMQIFGRCVLLGHMPKVPPLESLSQANMHCAQKAKQEKQKKQDHQEKPQVTSCSGTHERECA